jgi:DNA-directed RNA polymerase specialized sigma24 family protein
MPEDKPDAARLVQVGDRSLREVAQDLDQPEASSHKRTMRAGTERRGR